MLLTHVTIPVDPVKLADQMAEQCAVGAVNLSELLARAQTKKQAEAIGAAVTAYENAANAMFALAQALEGVNASKLPKCVAIL